MDKLGAFFNNITNEVIQSQIQPARRHPVIRRYGHAFLLWYTSTYTLAAESLAQNPCYLTDVELRRLHRRFGHPSVHRLHQLLERSGHNVELQALQYLTRYCEQCQKHGRSPGRFTFTLKDDLDFNYNVIIDIMYIGGKPVLHLVDEATRFQAGRWLKNVSAQHVWDQLRSCWIDTYLGPPDLVTADAGKQFMAKEFKQYAANMGIIVKNAPVEAHHSIGMVERYHGPLRRVYSIISTEIPGIEPDLALQMSFKTINDSVGPNGLVPTLLVFGAYPRMTELDAPSPSITQRAMAMKKAMDEVRKCTASRQVNDALNTRNGPSTASVHDLPINSPVLVYREGKASQSGEWKGPYNLLSIQGESVIIELPHGPTKFRSTSIKPYFIDGQEPIPDSPSSTQVPPAEEAPPAETGPPETPQTETSPADITPIEPAAKSPSATLASLALVKRGRGQPRKYLEQANIAAPSDICFLMDEFDVFINKNSDAHPAQYTASRQKEITGLLEKGVFKVVTSKDVPSNARIFNSRFVDEVKNAGTDKAYEKSRLVVQAYNDQEKDLVLTQSPTIQRVSQRLIVCLAAMLQDNNNMKLYLRDITQAYVQSTSKLNRDFYIRPPLELISLLGAKSDCIVKVMKPLYGVPEAGNHWFAIYHTHHKEKLGMTKSTYDSCLFFRSEPLGIVGMQIDDILILADNNFASTKEEAIKSAKIITKDREYLTSAHPLKFNSAQIKLDSNGIVLTKKSYIGGILLVTDYTADSTSSKRITKKKLSPKKEYLAQKAIGAYIASVCQPKASFDLS